MLSHYFPNTLTVLNDTTIAVAIQYKRKRRWLGDSAHRHALKHSSGTFDSIFFSSVHWCYNSSKPCLQTSVSWIFLKCHSLPLFFGGGVGSRGRGFSLFALEGLQFLTLLKFLELGVIRPHFLSQIHHWLMARPRGIA